MVEVTKAQAKIAFDQAWEESLKIYPQLAKDRIAKKVCWLDFVDSLNKQGLVSDKQAGLWTNPY